MRWFAFLLCCVLAGAEAPALKNLQLADAIRWKRASGVKLSHDGQWMAYLVVPGEGNAEVVVRHLTDGKEQRFPAGETSPFGGSVSFSDDSKWLAFLVNPTFEEGKRLKKERRPPQRKALVVELATGTKTEFEKVKTVAFSGRRSTHLAVHRAGADLAPVIPMPSATPAPTTPSRPQGSDLLLHELATGAQLNIGNVSEFAFNKEGTWCAWIVDAADQAGNGVQLRDMSTGAVLPLDSAKANYKSLTWTEKGDAFTTLRGVEDKAFEEKLYAVVAAKLTGATPEKSLFDPKEHTDVFPKGYAVSGNRAAQWNDSLTAFTFGIIEPKTKKNATPAAKEDEKPPAVAPAKPTDDVDKADLILWHWRDKRLQPMQQVQESMDKNFSYLAIYHPAAKKFVRLADADLKNVTAGPRAKLGWGTDIRAYEWMSNLDGRRYSDISTVNLETGERKPVLMKARYNYGASPDGSRFAYYENGHFWILDGATGRKVNVTEKAKVSFVDTEDDHNVEKPPTRFLGWSNDSNSILLTDNWDLWRVGFDGKSTNLTGNGRRDQIRYQGRIVLDPEEKGIDFTKPLYVPAYGEWTKKSGFGRIDPAKPGVTQMLAWDDAVFSALVKAKEADSFLYTRATIADYPDYWHTAKADLSAATKVTSINPQQKEYSWASGYKLISYTSDKGDKLQATLLLPAGYEPGKRYPTVVQIYEKMSRFGVQYPMPSDNYLNPAIFTSNGYAVLYPDIVYKLNDPGMSAVWCVPAAVKAAIAAGYVDETRIGLQGHSWGGYQTAFLVTQTKMFKAAVAGAPLTDLVSMYSSVYWNTGSANQPIFESSQGRFTGGYWEQSEAYIRNSPVYHAKNVETPLMMLHNDKDGAVDFTQGIEYFNTLRRLNKPVILLQYKGENHGLVKPANRRDYAQRMQEFFDYHLKSAGSPMWMEDGVPHLKLPDHLEERARALSEALKPPKPAAAAKTEKRAESPR